MALTLVTSGSTVTGTYNNVKETFPQSTQSTLVATQSIATTDTIVAGTGYTTTTIPKATTSSGSGTGCTVTYTAVAGGVTVVNIVTAGTGYAIDDTQTIVAGGSDATFAVATLNADTIAVLGRFVDGTDTTFLTDCQKGDSIWLLDNDEIIEIESISSDIRLVLKNEATTDTSTLYKIVKKNGFNNITFNMGGVAAGEINGLSLTKDINQTLSTNGRSGFRISPILIDSSVNSSIITVVAQ